MKSNAVNANQNRKNIGWGILSLTALMVLFVTGKSFAADELKLYQWIKSEASDTEKASWKHDEIKPASDNQKQRGRDLLVTEFAQNPEKSAKDWISGFTYSKDRPDSKNNFVAMAESFVAALQFEKTEAQGNDNFKARTKGIRDMLTAVLTDKNVRGAHYEKGAEDKFKLVSNKAGLERMIKAILDMADADPDAFKNKDISDILKEVFDSETLRLLGLSETKETLKPSPSPSESPSPSASPSATPTPTPVAATSPAPPAPPVTAVPTAPTERAPVACIPTQAKDNVGPFIDELLKGLLPQANNRPQLDPGLAALADRVAPEKANEAQPLASNSTPFNPFTQPASTPAPSNNDSLRPDQQQEQPAPFFGALPTLETATQGRVEYKKPTDDGTADLNNITQDLNTANTKKKRINTDLAKPELNPASFVSYDRNGRPQLNQYGFFNAFGKLSEYAYTAKAYASRLASNAQAALQKVKALEAEKKKLDPELALVDPEKVARLEQQVKEAENYSKTISEGMSNAIGTARDAIQQRIGQVNQFVTAAKAELEKERKNTKAGAKNQNEVVIAGLDANIAELRTQAKNSQTESEEWDAIASNAESKVSQGQNTLAMATAPQTDQVAGGVRNAQKLAGVAGNRRGTAGIGAGMGAANTGIAGNVTRGKLGATSNQGGNI